MKKLVGRRDFIVQLTGTALGWTAGNPSTACSGKGVTFEANEPMLENDSLRLVLDHETGCLARIVNKLTSESFQIRGDDFEILAEEFHLDSRNARLESLEKRSERRVEARYGIEGRRVLAIYQLGPHFVEKHLLITSASPYRLRTVVVSRLSLSGTRLKLVKYPYQKNVTYFARSPEGGVALGIELPFAASGLEPDGTITLGYKPSLKVKANERLESEPAYLTVYKRRGGEGGGEGIPLRSESEAMVAMTSTLFGPPRHGFVPMACDRWCEMEHFAYVREQQVEADKRSIDFLAECGINWVSDCHPWGGETEKLNNLREGQRYEPGL